MHRILKNGESVSIRPIKRQDALKRHAFFVDLSLAKTGMVHTPDETDFHVAESEAMIDDFLKNNRGLWLIALDSRGNVIGEVDIIIKNLARVLHVGKLTLGVHPSCQRQGLGSLLMEEALLWAKKRLLRIELTVFKSNVGALALYKKFGFMLEGERKNYLRHEDGTFENDLMMALLLE